MPENKFNTLQEYLTGWKNNTGYFGMLSLIAQLSRLFSESDVPFLHYRVTENIFCRYFNAQNDARSCTAYDARIAGIGIGIKTFIINNGKSLEKIAEFDKLKPELNKLSGIDLARKLGEFRNDRMHFANNAYNVTESTYHIVGREPGSLKIFNCPYEEIDIDNIRDVKDTDSSLTFNDGINSYSFLKSKSTLAKRFYLPNDHVALKIEILENPLDLLEDFIKGQTDNIAKAKKLIPGYDYIVLPLYSVRSHEVAPKSGLNQWNAGGRPRHHDEVYIPIPKKIHDYYPDFFPSRDIDFTLLLPDGNEISAKICQDGGKALMSNPNKSLGEWILRKVLNKRPGELVTMDDLNLYGFDSICVENLHTIDDSGKLVYRLSFAESDETYSSFIQN